jgi:serine acetyltransferase
MVAAGSVVNRSVPEGRAVAGIPHDPIRHIPKFLKEWAAMRKKRIFSILGISKRGVLQRTP